MADHDAAPDADPAAAPVYGTALPDAPVGRLDFERAIRSLNMSDLDLREALLNLAARVVALTDEVTRRIDGVEPLPAAPNTPAPPATVTVEAAVDAALPDTLSTIQAADARTATRVSIDLGLSKYQTPSPDIPCAELIPLCGGRCCTLSFSLSTEDLDEGVIRWDYGQPYLIRQRASDGYCVHNDPDTRGCTVHAYRPRVCRSYDCRKDKRVWIDYERRISAPMPHGTFEDRGKGTAFDLLERARARAGAVRREMTSISESYADGPPHKGPVP
jgi:Fe-S-cluster containining protein